MHVCKSARIHTLWARSWRRACMNTKLTKWTHQQHKLHSPTCQGVTDFSERIKEMSFSSCWGDAPDLSTWTTRNARTYLQPQLQKAVGISDAARKGQVNLKVWRYICICGSSINIWCFSYTLAVSYMLAPSCYQDLLSEALVCVKVYVLVFR
jgi:hypothetical protein